MRLNMHSQTFGLNNSCLKWLFFLNFNPSHNLKFSLLVILSKNKKNIQYVLKVKFILIPYNSRWQWAGGGRRIRRTSPSSGTAPTPAATSGSWCLHGREQWAFIIYCGAVCYYNSNPNVEKLLLKIKNYATGN